MWGILGTISDWVTYTPTLTYASGAAWAVASSTFRWRREGGLIRTRFVIGVAAAGIAAAGLRFTLPFASVALPIPLRQVGQGQVVQSSVRSLQTMLLQTSTAQCAISYAGANGMSADFTTVPPTGWAGAWGADAAFAGELLTEPA